MSYLDELTAAWTGPSERLDFRPVCNAAPAVPGQHSPLIRYMGCPCDRCFPPRGRFRTYEDDPAVSHGPGDVFAYARPLRRALDDYIGVGLPGAYVPDRHSVVIEVGEALCLVRVFLHPAEEPARATAREAEVDLAVGPGFVHLDGESRFHRRRADAWTPGAARKDANELIVDAIRDQLATAAAKGRRP